MSAEKLVIVGGDAAAMSAASQARRGRTDLGIVAFEKGPYVSYAACGIPYYVSGLVDDFDKLLIRTPEEFRQRQSIEARVRQEVVHILPAEAKVVVRDLEVEAGVRRTLRSSSNSHRGEGRLARASRDRLPGRLQRDLAR